MKQFIEEKVAKRINGYRYEHELITSEYERENELLKSYRGREILELIQNAEDELIDGKPKEILISFDGKFLSVANYGEPFSEEGITSLMYSNTSGKKNRKKKVIGNKGTGFRAILGWSKEIYINSENLHIKFSYDHAQSVLKNVVFRNEHMPKKLKCATLVFPEWNENYKETKYTTEIIIHIKPDDDVANDIRNQLQNLNDNLLLFLNNTETLSVNLEGNIIRFEKYYLGHNVVKLTKTVNGIEEWSEEWTLNKKEGVIGDENYSIVIAHNSTDEMPEMPYIYTYFQTDVKFPFPVLLHADFNLNGDRNHLIKHDSSNKIILKDVADLLVDTSIKINNGKVSYDRIKFLIPKEPIARELDEYDFTLMLREKMKQSSIFPTVNQKYVSFNTDLVFYKSFLAKYLSGRGFENLLMCSDDSSVDNLLYDISLDGRYNWQTAVSKINKWVETRKVTEENIRHIAFTAIEFQEEYKDDFHFGYDSPPSFFFNQDRKLIKGNKPIFLVDKDIVISKPPIFANIEFMDPYMRNYLFKVFREEKGDKDTDVILENMEKYNIRKYNTDELMEIVNSVLKEKAESGKRKEAKERWKTLIKWLWTNRELFIKENKKYNILFLNREDGLKESKSLCYGIEYGNEITENLLHSMPKYLVCDLKKYIDYIPDDDITAFLDTFNINKFPEIITRKDRVYTSWYNSIEYFKRNAGEYVSELLSNIKTPLCFDDEVFQTLEDFEKTVTILNVERSTIASLEEILNNSTTSSIIRWIQNDSKLQNHLFNGVENSKMIIEAMWGSKRNERQLKNTTRNYSYIYHLFKTIPWIQKGERRYKLSDCLFGINAYDADLSDYLIEPDIQEYIKGIEGPKGKLKKEYISLFEKLHVQRDFGELSVKKIYQVLNHLPEIDHSEEIAKRFYNALIDGVNNEISDSDLNCKEYRDYVTNGKILTNNGYQPVVESYYLDGKDVCERVANSYNLICVPKKRNRKRIKRLLGVDQLILVGKLVNDPVQHLESREFSIDLNEFKMFAFAYRLHSVKDIEDEKRKFNNLSINLCSDVLANYSTSEDDPGTEVHLEDYEYILDGNSNYYLKAPDYLTFKEMRHNQELANAVANIFASYLDVDEIIPEYTHLYYVGNYNERIQVIHHKFEDIRILNETRRILSINEDLREEFLNILVKLTEKSPAEISNYIEELDFYDFKSDLNSLIIVDLFRRLEIDISDYNDENPSIPIDLKPYYEKEIHKNVSFYEEKYKCTWFARLIDKPLEQKKKLVENFLLFKQIDVRTENSVYFDLHRQIINQFQIDENVELIDLTRIYNQNLLSWSQKQSNKQYIDEFVTKPEVMSLVYYSETAELNRLYKEFCQRYEPIDQVQEPSNIVIKNVSVYHASVVPVQRQKRKPISKKTTGFTEKRLSKKENERIGFIGERTVYEYLLNSKIFKLVKWVSENAKKAGINPEGSAGFGYDIECIDNAGNNRYIEVKASKNGTDDEIKFFMSDNEAEFGRKNTENYFVYYVCDVNTNPKILILDDLFRNRDFNRKDFTIEIKNEYTISTEIENMNIIETNENKQ